MHYIEIVHHKNENIKKKAPAVQILFAYGVPKRIRTFGLQSRSLTLYPAELWAHAALLLYHIEDRMQARIKKIAAHARRAGGNLRKKGAAVNDASAKNGANGK